MTEVRVNNTFNDFIMLANTQFIENVSMGPQGSKIHVCKCVLMIVTEYIIP